MVRFRACGSLLALALAVSVVAALSQSPPDRSSGSRTGSTVALQVGESLQSLQSAVGALDADQLHLPKREKRAIADGQAALMRNLTQAIPALLQAFRDAPDNLGAAFRLYRDADAVLAVAQRSVAVLPPNREDGDRAGDAALRTATGELRESLDRLGSWIEVKGSADYAARQIGSRPGADTPLTSGAGAAPPATLVIQDANSTAKSKTKQPDKKKKGPGSIPHL